MKLTIYADELFQQVREVREVPRMKIPYRSAVVFADLLQTLDFDNIDDQQVLTLVLQNHHLITQVVQATFALPEEDLAYIDVMELGALAGEIIGYVLGKVAELGEGQDPNAPALATI